MKRFLTKLFIQLLSKLDDKEHPKADMYLPVWTKIISLICIPFGIFIIILSIKDQVMYLAYLLGIPFILLGIFLFIYSNNKQINIISDDEFEFTNAFGKKTIYRFSDIQNMLIKSVNNDLVNNQHAITIIFANKRIKLEEECIISKRLWDILLAKYKSLNNEIL